MSLKEAVSKDQPCGIQNIYKGQMVVDGAGVRINDYVAGFPTHPHRGIETITYMKHGSFRHRDSRLSGRM